jgi:hypothetical protein
VDFAGVDGEADALEDLFALDARREIFDFEILFCSFEIKINC